jgi:hypothetical protein
MVPRQTSTFGLNARAGHNETPLSVSCSGHAQQIKTSMPCGDEALGIYSCSGALEERRSEKSRNIEQRLPPRATSDPVSAARAIHRRLPCLRALCCGGQWTRRLPRSVAHLGERYDISPIIAAAGSSSHEPARPRVRQCGDGLGREGRGLHSAEDGAPSGLSGAGDHAYRNV